MMFPLTYMNKIAEIVSSKNFIASFGTKNYTFENPYTHEQLIKEITVLPRISENNNLTIDYSDL